MNLLEQIRVVLVQTSHPGNIGASARAMKTMGLSDLRLVLPARYPSALATAMASGADDLLVRTPVHKGLDEALAGCRLVLGTSARQRSLRWPELSPRDGALALVEAATEGPVALLFGREQSGLSNEELDRCHALITIPADEAYSSLNLAAAVQVLSYEIRLAALKREAPVLPSKAAAPEDQAATAEMLEGLYAHFERALVRLDFLDADNPRHLMRRLRRLFGRAGPTVNEVNILRGILTAAEKGPRR